MATCIVTLTQCQTHFALQSSTKISRRQEIPNDTWVTKKRWHPGRSTPNEHPYKISSESAFQLKKRNHKSKKVHIDDNYGHRVNTIVPLMQ